ncbi:MAG: peptidylprolyl isomerase [Nitrospira sp.]|nr:peptidylprolyl isomerase [bacterium]MBL7049172.1 peptidylprolyl isomerase [Nitrospira sp.]
MAAVENGNTVKVHYTGTLDNGEIFDSSRDREPLEFTLGQGQLIDGFEKAVIGLSAGESTVVRIEADNAYGLHREELVIEIKREHVPANIDLQEGAQLSLSNPEGGVINVVVTSVEDDHITVDANHPLANKDLTFNIELVEIL